MALANAMLGYPTRGFCGTINAQVSRNRTHAAVKVWTSSRIVEVFGDGGWGRM